MRRIENLISDSRKETNNAEFTSTTGIADNEFVRFLNDAQDALFSDFAKAHQTFFQETKQIPVVQGQDTYDLPDDCYLDNRVSVVWYSKNGQSVNNRRLVACSMEERIFVQGSPVGYIRSSGKLILNVVPQDVGAVITLLYIRKPKKLDKRRAKILTATTVGSGITSLILDTTDTIEDTDLLAEDYCSVVDRFGNTTMSRIPITAIDTTTGVVTIDTFSFQAGETIAAGSYIVRGFSSTNICELPDTCERYLIAHCNWKVLKTDSSQDSAESNEELSVMRSDIVDTFKNIDDDIKSPAITDVQFMDDEDI